MGITRNHRNLIAPLGALALACIVALVMALAQGQPAQAAQGCANSGATAKHASVKELRKAMTCLIGKTRRQDSRHKVKAMPSLRGLEQKHAHVMVNKNCFKHACPGEGTLPARIQASGYLDVASSYGYGENTGCANTPRKMLAAWLKSSYHRKNLLGKSFRHIGVGVVKGHPKSQTACKGAGYMTFSVLFAWRKS